MSGNKQAEDGSFTVVLMLLGLIAVLLWLLWYFFGDHIMNAIRWLRVGELWLVGILTGNEGVIELRDAAIKAERIKWPQVVVLTRETMPYYKWPIALILGAATIWLTLKAPDSKFKRRHTIDTLMRSQAKSWPVISPILRFNPTKDNARVPGKAIPAKLPMFAEALSPEEWVAYNRIPLINGSPDRDSIRRALIPQLGRRWQGVDTRPDYIRALFVAFALKGARKRQESDEILGEIALCWTPEKGLILTPELSRKISKLIADPEVGGDASKVAAKFAYTTTAMLGLLKYSRDQGGVLAPSTFLWLRAEDRALWYPLNNLGRLSFHPEAAGAMSHYMAEAHAGKPLIIPRVEAAIDSISIYLSEQKPAIPPVEEGKKPSSTAKKRA